MLHGKINSIIKTFIKTTHSTCSKFYTYKIIFQSFYVEEDLQRKTGKLMEDPLGRDWGRTATKVMKGRCSLLYGIFTFCTKKLYLPIIYIAQI